MQQIHDFGPMPYAVNIDNVTTANRTYRTAIWTGKNLQATVMCINPGDDIGLEIHHDTDQFIRLEEGCGLVQMGLSRDNLYYQQHVQRDWAVFVPAGTWHNITNTGHGPMKVYTIYAPPHHPWGTIHQTKAIAEQMEGNADANG
ncbi:MAG: cupin domain-containing protein [Firmicutes bacterium]|nr:cupin domain-containing protein [Bacillota bacterium]